MTYRKTEPKRKKDSEKENRSNNNEKKERIISEMEQQYTGRQIQSAKVPSVCFLSEVVCVSVRAHNRFLLNRNERQTICSHRFVLFGYATEEGKYKVLVPNIYICILRMIVGYSPPLFYRDYIDGGEGIGDKFE